ncbi:DUF4233 domain-containing protein [Nesterenkonia sp.]|uniref:DUF4233 domain-containing protein n=1 Tax=Nesterenkonia sp. TaxID=704201 RepID=UPI0026320047|nr:DUF4233 domain-containing protein [Nesterenkonia sp.]
MKALFASTVLCLEAALMFFFALAAWGLNQNQPYVWWVFAGLCLLAVVMVGTCAVLHTRIGYPLGWALQVLMTGSFVAVAVISSQGLIVPLALIPGLGFAACWWYAVSRGAQIDREKMKRYRLEEELDRAAQQRSGPPAEPERPSGTDNSEEQTS